VIRRNPESVYKQLRAGRRPEHKRVAEHCGHVWVDKGHLLRGAVAGVDNEPDLLRLALLDLPVADHAAADAAVAIVCRPRGGRGALQDTRADLLVFAKGDGVQLVIVVVVLAESL
jgi:hypothetical protein